MIRTFFDDSVFGMKDEITKLARAAAEEYILWNKTPLVRAGFVICDEEHFRGMKLSEGIVDSRGGCYVLVKKNGILRGCMGSLSAAENDFASEIIRNSIAAVSKDVRFDAVCAEELPHLEYSVFFVKDVTEITSAGSGTEAGSTDTGVIVSAGCRQAVVLPFEDEGLSFADKIKEACIRGNICLDEKPLIREIIFA